MSIVLILTAMLNKWLFFSGFVRQPLFPQPLSKEEEQRLLIEMEQGSEEAKQRLVEHNLRLVAHIVKKYSQHKEETEELISIGTIGLMKGIDSFSREKGAKLATYAARCIENEILMHYRSLKKRRNDCSLYEALGEDAEGQPLQWLDILQSEPVDVVEQMEWKTQLARLERYLATLDERERFVILQRFGLGAEEKTQKEVAEVLGISRSYVSRIEKRALAKMFQLYHKLNTSRE